MGIIRELSRYKPKSFVASKSSSALLKYTCIAQIKPRFCLEPKAKFSPIFRSYFFLLPKASLSLLSLSLSHSHQFLSASVHLFASKRNGGKFALSSLSFSLEQEPGPNQLFSNPSSLTWFLLGVRSPIGCGRNYERLGFWNYLSALAPNQTQDR